MSDIYNDIAGVKGFEKPVCRVAYTINNTQPVICTIIDDHPLFYLDFESDYEDEELFDAADLNILEGEINAMKHEMKSFNKKDEIKALSSEEKITTFIEDKNFMLKKAEKETSSIDELLSILSTSRLAKSYIDFAAQHDVKIIHSSQIRTAIYDRSAGLIMVNPYIDAPQQMLLIARELRRHFQHRQGALINPLMFNPDNSVLINRVQVADLVTSMIRVAWELQLSGEKTAWDYIENSTFGDLGRAFAREAYMDFRTINNGQAAAAIFEAWFLSERPRAEDKTLINQMLADHKGYVFDCDEAEKQITPQLICALGEMPFGKNYLAEHALTIMDDAIFTDVRDRSNANFLWFIKFERSFRETEQELQTSERPAAEGVLPAASLNTQDLSDETTAQTATIVQLHTQNGSSEQPGDKQSKSAKRLLPSGEKGRNDKQGGGSNVVYLRRWSGE